jgi:hypothetical protein
VFGFTASRVYSVHVPAKPGRGVEQAVFVPEGFSWGAFAFSALWAIGNRMWSAAIAMLAILALVAWLPDAASVDPALPGFLITLFSLYFGFCGNDWYRAALERRGYREAGVVVAPGLVAAEQRWFARHFAHGQGAPS